MGRVPKQTFFQGRHLHVCWIMSDTLQPHGCNPARLLYPLDSPGKNTGVGCHFLLQGIFPTQGLDLHFLCLLHCQADSLPLHHLGTPKKDIHMSNKHRKWYSTSLIIRIMQLKTTVRYHLTHVEMTVIKKTHTKKMLEDVEKRKSLYCWSECKLKSRCQLSWFFCRLCGRLHVSLLASLDSWKSLAFLII